MADMKKTTGPANVGTVKKYANVATKPVDKTYQPKFQKSPNHGAPNKGQMRGNAQPDKFADPMNDGVNAAIKGFEGKLYDDIGERSGFITDGYLDKSDTPYGEAAKFNFLPPGMDISNQENIEVNDMPLRKLIAESYPGDGWMPAPQDIEE